MNINKYMYKLNIKQYETNKTTKEKRNKQRKKK